MGIFAKYLSLFRRLPNKKDSQIIYALLLTDIVCLLGASNSHYDNSLRYFYRPWLIIHRAVSVSFF